MFGLDKIVGGILGAGAADDASDAQANAHRDAIAMQEKMYNQQRADHQPWRESGVRALSGMENADFQRDFTAQDFQQDPGYNFRMQEGQKALERSAAARGGLQSGGMMKALSRYGQDVASNEYQNAYNRFNADRDRRFGRLSGLAGMGQNAAGQMSGAAQNFANQYGANSVGIGDAKAAGILGKANSWANFAGGIGDLAGDTMKMAAGAPSMGGGGGGGANLSNWGSMSEMSINGGGGYGGGRSYGLMGRR
jgi:hypothetical protein